MDNIFMSYLMAQRNPPEVACLKSSAHDDFGIHS
jgi:hypothetical protein